jgi:hypothetical protein
MWQQNAREGRQGSARMTRIGTPNYAALLSSL